MKKFGFLLLLIPTIALIVFAGKTLESGDYSVDSKGVSQVDVSKLVSMVFSGNDQPRITVETDGKAVASAKGAFVISNKDVIVPARLANDIFDCFAYLDNDDILHLQRGSYRMDIPVTDGNAGSLGVFSGDDGYYLLVSKICSGLNLEYEYNVEERKLTIFPVDEQEGVLPARFDLRDYGRAPEIKNQGTLGTCWAFAALSCVEAANTPREILELSPDHMIYNNSFGLDINTGGAYTMGMAYLLGWQGPVNENQDPYNDGATESGLRPVKHVQEIRFVDEKDYEGIKRCVYKYGPVETNIRNTLTSAESTSPHFNREHNAYYYSGKGEASHEIIIVGWDDNYPRENFNNPPEGDGAFICQNSWGKEFGEAGYFYVSYYDSIIGQSNLVYSSVEEPDNYDNIYQTDLCGWVGQVGCGSGNACGMNVYTAASDSNLEALGFYATSKGMSYKLYVINDFTNYTNVDLSALEPVASGSLDMTGYYTIPVDKVGLKKGERFAVAMELSSPDNTHPIAVEHMATEITQNALISDGEGYISERGSDWLSTEKEFECNVCLKAYTKDIK